jgi:hypothetical protein
MSDDGNDENTSMPSGHETEDEDTEIFDKQARDDIAALKEKVAELELKQNPRAQNARRESTIGNAIFASTRAEPAIQEEIEKAREIATATAQEEARKMQAIGEWVKATKLAADKATQAADKATRAAAEAAAWVAKASEKQPDKFEALNTMFKELQDMNKNNWVGVEKTVNETVKKVNETITGIKIMRQEAYAYITEKADIQVGKIQREAFALIETRITKLEAIETDKEKRLSNLETLTSNKLMGQSGESGESGRYKI